MGRKQRGAWIGLHLVSMVQQLVYQNRIGVSDIKVFPISGRNTVKQPEDAAACAIAAAEVIVVTFTFFG